MAEPQGGEVARAAAARALTEVLVHGRSLAAVLPPALAAVPPAMRGLVQELCYGTLRWAPRLQALAAQLITKPLRERDSDIHALILLGLYQLLYLNIPPHAAVSLTVSATNRLGKGWAKGLVNGILRRLQREQTTLLTHLEGDAVASSAHPAWLLERLRSDWPEDWHSIVAANNARPPMTLRVNRLRGSRAQYLERLRQAGLDAAPHPHAPDALVLAEAVPVERLPGFAAGEVSVQDAAAQLAAGLLAVQPGQRVLDACAAPGGKTGHLLETCPDASLLALDSDGDRLTKVAENLSRLGLAARLQAADAADAGRVEGWWDGEPFDRILLDAPCSGSGVIRRHPDIKVLRRPADIPALVQQQEQLLRALWPTLAPGGILVYATCSVLPAENAAQITRFLGEQADAHEEPMAAPWGRAQPAGRQILPGESEMDGFYYACLRKC